ncbi:ORF MSV224 putative NTPase/helicase [Melanoplus sanguinipes entomopoxvirus]|uniref:ORF MSV224 putative NTPase/helicase n=1 Tax=Melanoplus sanguinipes entomopoxvirus TaxID=83191 RepID=Q9YVL8_MSEPV|nr:ORF MSV224 putative NTPase/helicase [Melanoplus sanguinipes entomopoxvirus]AAC97709.1 ORF MSV224 putative NTPase/helicase [Melanoplus sanguinipes entomopoxvirus 'O']
MECELCLEKNKSTIQCDACKYITCIPCIIKFNKTICPKCYKIYSDILIMPFIENKIFFNIYKSTYVKSKITIKDARLYDYILKNKKLLRFGKSLNYKSCIDINSFLCLCNTPSCKGIISKNNPICLFCDSVFCTKCKEKILEYNHTCNEKILETIKLLKESTMLCPNCLTYITKSYGCNDMFCTNCGTRFCWRTGQRQKYNSNTHYKVNNTNVYEYINDLSQTGKFINHAVKYLRNFNNKIMMIECKHYNNDKIVSNAYMNYKKFDFFKYIYDNKKKCDNIYNLKELIYDYYSKNIVSNNCLYTINNNNIIISKTKNKNIKIMNDKDENNDSGIEMIDYIQEIHAYNIKKILLKYKKAYDLSIPGSGKSYVALYVAKQMNLKNIFIICPACLVDKWNFIIKKYNKYNNFNYIILSNNNICINRFEDGNILLSKLLNVNNKIIYEPTEFLKNFLSSESMIIIDESHTIRNTNSYTLKAIYKIVNTSIGYILNISATPIENKNQLQHVVKKLGINDNSEDSDIMKLFIEYILRICEIQDIIKVYKNRYIYQNVILSKNFNTFIGMCKLADYENTRKLIYLDYINKSYISLNKILFNKIAYTAPIYNVIQPYLAKYKMNNRNEETIDLAFTNINVEDKTSTLEFGNKIVKGLMQIETAILESIENMVYTVLENTNNVKVVVALNYTDSINDIYKELSKFYDNILVITGKTNNKTKIIEKFQEPNNNYRLLIVNPLCVNNGLDFDDKYGNYKRFVIFNPNLISINMYQFIYRFERKDSKSKPIIHILDTHYEVVDNLIKKVKIQNDIFKAIKKIREYPEWIETETSVLQLLNELNKH